MRLLVTGGLGYIGSEVVAAAAGGANVQIVTFSRSSPRPEAAPPANATHEQGSILDEERLSQVLARHQVTHIVHAAGARTGECTQDPLVAIESNVLGTDMLFRAAKATPSVSRIVFISTGAVYGAVSQPIDESYPIAPNTHYAVAKAAAEMAAKGHAANARFSTAIVRPGFVMGPARPGVISKARLNGFVQAALTNQEVQISFAGRFFVHLASALGPAIVTLLNADLPVPVDTFHLPGRVSTLDQFADALQEVAAASGFSPAIKAAVDPAFKVPENLDSRHYENTAGGAPSPDLQTMIRAVADDVAGRDVVEDG